MEMMNSLLELNSKVAWVSMVGCFVAKSNKCAEADKQHIANMMTVITTSTFALYAAEK